MFLPCILLQVSILGFYVNADLLPNIRDKKMSWSIGKISIWIKTVEFPECKENMSDNWKGKEMFPVSQIFSASCVYISDTNKIVTSRSISMKPSELQSSNSAPLELSTWRPRP